jgi:hypothetical protein
MCGTEYEMPPLQRNSWYCSRECAQKGIIISRKKYQIKYAPRKRIWERKNRAKKRRELLCHAKNTAKKGDIVKF